MQTRFHLDMSVANAAIGVFIFGFLLMSIPLVTAGSYSKLVVSLGALFVILGLVWTGLARGTHVTVADGKICGKVFFIRGKITVIADIVEIKQRKTFGGLMAEVYMTYRTKSGTLLERGLIGKQGLKKSDLKNLLAVIRSANPAIEIDPELLK
jgi:hypothetical protein